MQRYIFTLFILTTIFFNNCIKTQNLLLYSDPVKNADYVNCNSNVIIRFNDNVIANTDYIMRNVEVNGSINGRYSFKVIRSGDVYILEPETHFKTGEKISVRFNGFRSHEGIKTENDEIVFFVSSSDLSPIPLLGFKNEIPDYQFKSLSEKIKSSFFDPVLPEINVQYYNNPAPGNLFLSNIVFNTAIPNVPYLLILNNDGSAFNFKEMSGQIFDFDRQSNGRYTYFNRIGNKYYEIDSNFTVTDSFYTGNGYFTDIHELRVLPNRHALLMSYDKQVIDMSKLVAGGDSAALVTGLILQEIDENKNVVFQWKSWDHIPVTDAVHEDLTAHDIDYVHGNAIELDNDGNILLSSRHLDEITKINRSTGDIIWRLGGKQNQFLFPNDPDKFNYQHGIRRLANGHIILFDNGNFHSPSKSRAVEYSLDEFNKIATKVWEYQNNPVIFGYAMGFAQRLPNGNTLISWGATNPTFTEVKPDGSKTLQMNFKTGVFSYRVFKYEFGSNITNINSGTENIPTAYKLYQNYPNPFNPSTVIRYDIPYNSYTEINIYDCLGRLVKQLVNGEIKEGSYSINVDLSDNSSGLYFIKMNAGSFSAVNKIMLVK